MYKFVISHYLNVVSWLLYLSISILCCFMRNYILYAIVALFTPLHLFDDIKWLLFRFRLLLQNIDQLVNYIVSVWNELPAGYK